MTIEERLKLSVEAALHAGKTILEIYNSEFTVEHKEDKSPLTLADKRAHEIIQTILSRSSVPVLSEEGKMIPYPERSKWKELWIVDPLDGTKEFIKRNGEFTVNIALVKNGFAYFGVIYQPATDLLYIGDEEKGAFKVKNASILLDNGASYASVSKAGKLPSIHVPLKYTIVASRSHLSAETSVYIEEQKKKYGEVECVSSGSSLKLCMVAEGLAHVYPRFAPTMEWDIAAGHAILKAAGKNVYSYQTGEELRYNKSDLRNDWFIAK